MAHRFGNFEYFVNHVMCNLISVLLAYSLSVIIFFFTATNGALFGKALQGVFSVGTIRILEKVDRRGSLLRGGHRQTSLVVSIANSSQLCECVSY